jgi:hypothetical protein
MHEMQWEYHVTYLKMTASIQEELDGRQGWELVGLRRISEGNEGFCSRSPE